MPKRNDFTGSRQRKKKGSAWKLSRGEDPLGQVEQGEKRLFEPVADFGHEQAQEKERQEEEECLPHIGYVTREAV